MIKTVDDRRVQQFLEGLSRQAQMPTHPTRSRPLQKQRHLAAAYDAAQYTEANRNYWANADLLSADAANSLEVRKTLRSRARYECLEANSFARGMVSTLANDTIGRGPTLQILLPKQHAATIEAHWRVWAKRVQLARKLRTARKSKFVDGEVFLRLVTNRKIKGPVQLDIEVVEADRVTNPLGLTDPVRDVDGILFDDDGNPVSYQVLQHHPGDEDYRVWCRSDGQEIVIRATKVYLEAYIKWIFEVGDSASIGLRRNGLRAPQINFLRFPGHSIIKYLDSVTESASCQELRFKFSSVLALQTIR